MKARKRWTYDSMTFQGIRCMMYDIIALKTFVYVRPHENDKPAFTKTPLWGPFENPRFRPENAVDVWTESRTEEKISVFKNIRRRENATSSPGLFLAPHPFFKGKALGTRLVRTGSVFFYLPEAISLALASKSVSQSFAAWILNLSASSGTVIIV